jgi:Rrf2 family transcriptional regulator, iron-sulfur cluster assembly transcription factor
MKITAPEEYGLRCLLQLAKLEQGSLVSVKEIASKEGLSQAYVEKLLRLLARSGLVHSVRGIKGGYVLNRPAAQISIAEVVRSLGRVPTTEHICTMFTGKRSSCIHFSNCGIRSVWSGLVGYIQDFLSRTTLASLLEDEYTVSGNIANGKALKGNLSGKRLQKSQK